MKFFLFLIGAIALMSFLLGLWSQKGAAAGLRASGQLADVGTKPNCVSSEADTQPERLVDPLKANISQIKAALEATGGTITTETDTYLSATYMSRLFKYVDDVELRKQSDGVWHIRSASRVGHSDMGANAKRVAAIRAALPRS